MQCMVAHARPRRRQSGQFQVCISGTTLLQRAFVPLRSVILRVRAAALLEARIESLTSRWAQQTKLWTPVSNTKTHWLPSAPPVRLERPAPRRLARPPAPRNGARTRPRAAARRLASACCAAAVACICRSAASSFARPSACSCGRVQGVEVKECAAMWSGSREGLLGSFGSLQLRGAGVQHGTASACYI